MELKVGMKVRLKTLDELKDGYILGRRFTEYLGDEVTIDKLDLYDGNPSFNHTQEVYFLDPILIVGYDEATMSIKESDPTVTIRNI